MHSLLEEKRGLIEDLELLDYAITKRIKINPRIYTPKDSKLNHNILTKRRKISKPLTIIQKHESKRFLDKYNDTRLKLLDLLNDERNEIADENVFKREEYGRGNFAEFFKICEDLLESENKINESPITKDYEVYDIFSCNKNYNDLKEKINNLEDSNNLIKDFSMTKKESKKLGLLEKHRILSLYTTDIKLSSIFTTDEVFGSQLDLKKFYNKWLSLPRYKSLSIDNLPTYKKYLKELITRDGTIKIDSIEYNSYLIELNQYLEEFIHKIQPFDEIDDENNNGNNDKNDFKFKHEDFFCLSCNKQFSKDSVFKSHLNGKKHIKSVEKNNQILKNESKISYLIQFNLKFQYEKTINELDRIELLTVREREIEKRDYKPDENIENASIYQFFGSNFKLINKIVERFDDDEIDGNDGDGIDQHDIGNGVEDDDDEEDEDDDDEKLYNPLNLPLGSDGRPIPFWLWKLKGLGHEFKCEICDNAVFKGRSAFNKHFKESVHLEKLKKMGVHDNFIIFKDLSKKKDVLDLLDTLQKKYREQIQYVDNTEQVEDDEGNIMNKKVYEQLQKQGLL